MSKLYQGADLNVVQDTLVIGNPVKGRRAVWKTLWKRWWGRHWTLGILMEVKERKESEFKLMRKPGQLFRPYLQTMLVVSYMFIAKILKGQPFKFKNLAHLIQHHLHFH